MQTEEFFQDFDPLRHGSISENRFRMGLSAMGANVTESQFQALARAYADPKRSGNVLWNEFLVDVEVGRYWLFRLSLIVVFWQKQQVHQT